MKLLFQCRAGLIPVVLWCVVPLFPNPACAASLRSVPVTLAWDANTDPTVRGYALYYGPTNQPATNRIDAGSSQSVTFLNLQADVTYSFRAVSYSTNGTESVPSNQILVRPPALSRLQLTKQQAGFRIALKAAPGAVCRIEYADAPTGAAWRPLTNVTATTLGDVIALDTTTNKPPVRFYRAALATAAPANASLKLAKQTSGAMRVTLAGSAGATWRVQRATTPNATTWTTFATVTTSTVGEATATDTTAAQATSRFYRAVSP